MRISTAGMCVAAMLVCLTYVPAVAEQEEPGGEHWSENQPHWCNPGNEICDLYWPDENTLAGGHGGCLNVTMAWHGGLYVLGHCD